MGCSTLAAQQVDVIAEEITSPRSDAKDAEASGIVLEAPQEEYCSESLHVAPLAVAEASPRPEAKDVGASGVVSEAPQEEERSESPDAAALTAAEAQVGAEDVELARLQEEQKKKAAVEA